MRKASELGLEVIHLEDQVLLVDKNVSVNQEWGYNPINGLVSIYYGVTTKSPCIEIIAAKEKIADIPLLVIDDEKLDYSDEDLKKAFISGALTSLFNTWDISKEVYAAEKAEIYTKSITKELWIEIIDNGQEDWTGDDYSGEPFWNEKIEPRIIKGRLKAVWKRTE